MLVGIQGQRGSYSEIAAHKIFGKFGKEVDLRYFSTARACLESLDMKDLSSAVLPVENSIVGNLALHTDLLTRYQVNATQEFYLEVSHSLMVLPSTEISEIFEVRSHPVALDQCRSFIEKYSLRPIPVEDTAGAAKALCEKGEGQAVIASCESAKLYNLKILHSNIQDEQNNYTRFLVFSQGTADIESLTRMGQFNRKVSLAFQLLSHPGALMEVLEIFKKFELDLTKIESRPIPHKPFQYIFFSDFLLGKGNPKTAQKALNDLQKKCLSVHLIGVYPQAKFPPEK